MPMRRERLLLLLLFIAVVAVWWFAHAAALPDLTITLFDVGQGDSILIQSPGGQTMLIDGGGLSGESTRGYDVGREVVLPALLARQVRKIDLLVITHPHQDHVGGLLAVLQQVPVGLVLDPMLPEEECDEAYLEVRHLLREKKIDHRRARAGQRINLTGGVALEVLHPSDSLLTGAEANDSSVAMRLTYGKFSMFLAGDVETFGAQCLADRGSSIQSTVLKVPHHGSLHALSTSFFRTVHPTVAVISVGANNQFGHPTPEVIAELRVLGANLFRTDEDGAITIRVQPNRWRVDGYTGGSQAKHYEGKL